MSLKHPILLCCYYLHTVLISVTDPTQTPGIKNQRWPWCGTEPSSSLVFEMEVFSFTGSISQEHHLRLPGYVENRSVKI
ncbi:hypothetical protein D915_008489 [Fasciola hepatica]|uniref:Uncharacterized protein n=1 Tax=Fasciola hepatica TaxID=6192 RepID=A0A4E0R344_FASHE|nr:hypothetical protein D915_008489 [Fasciola hepatica]